SQSARSNFQHVPQPARRGRRFRVPGSTAAHGEWERLRMQIQCRCGKRRSLQSRLSLRLGGVPAGPFRPTRTGPWQPTSALCSWPSPSMCFALAVLSSLGNSLTHKFERSFENNDPRYPNWRSEEVMTITYGCDVTAERVRPKNAPAREKRIDLLERAETGRSPQE